MPSCRCKRRHRTQAHLWQSQQARLHCEVMEPRSHWTFDPDGQGLRLDAAGGFRPRSSRSEQLQSAGPRPDARARRLESPRPAGWSSTHHCRDADRRRSRRFLGGQHPGSGKARTQIRNRRPGRPDASVPGGRNNYQVRSGCDASPMDPEPSRGLCEPSPPAHRSRFLHTSDAVYRCLAIASHASRMRS